MAENNNVRKERDIKGGTHFTLAQSTTKPIDIDKMVNKTSSNTGKKKKNRRIEK